MEQLYKMHSFKVELTFLLVGKLVVYVNHLTGTMHACLCIYRETPDTCLKGF